MKNYSIKENQSKPFITNFNISEEVIDVFILGGKTLVIPNTKENLFKLREIMTKQALDARDSLGIKKRRKTEFAFLTVASVTGLVLVNTTSLGKEINPYISNASLAGITLLSGTGALINDSLIKDIRKLNLFVIHSKKLNEEISNNPYVYETINQRDKNLIEFWLEESSEPLTIEKMDKISYDSMKTIWENIRLFEELGLDYKVKELQK